MHVKNLKSRIMRD